MKEFQALKDTFDQLGHIPIDVWDEFSMIWELVEFKRKINITSVGQVERYTYFVLEGIQRIYYLDDTGKESTIVFTYEGDFGGVLDSYLLEEPSKYYYESLSKSVLLRCKKEDFDQAQVKHKSIKAAIDKALYLGFSGIMARLVELQSLSSEEKFKNLLRRSPHILHKIPHKYLANYIGIDVV